MGISYFWCERRDLNPYESPHTPLKRARLPIPPRSQIFRRLSNGKSYYIKGVLLCQVLFLNFLFYYPVRWGESNPIWFKTAYFRLNCVKNLTIRQYGGDFVPCSNKNLLVLNCSAPKMQRVRMDFCFWDGSRADARQRWKSENAP